MRTAVVSNHGVPAGRLSELNDGTFRFGYFDAYVVERLPPVSLTLPLRSEPYESPVLFPFFAGLLTEGATRRLQEQLFRVDERDDFGLLLATGQDTIGSVSVEAESTE